MLLVIYKGVKVGKLKDDIKEVAGATWLQTAKYREKWKSLKEALGEGQVVQKVFKKFGLLFYLIIVNCK